MGSIAEKSDSISDSEGLVLLRFVQVQEESGSMPQNVRCMMARSGHTAAKPDSMQEKLARMIAWQLGRLLRDPALARWERSAVTVTQTLRDTLDRLASPGHSLVSLDCIVGTRRTAAASLKHRLAKLGCRLESELWLRAKRMANPACRLELRCRDSGLSQHVLSISGTSGTVRRRRRPTRGR